VADVVRRGPPSEGAGPPEKSQRPHQRKQRALDARLFAHLEGLDDVAFGDVVVRAKADTTLEVRADLGGVVLEALERLNGEVVTDDLAVAADACLGVAADDARADDRAGDVSELGGAEDFADLGGAQLEFFVFRLKHALERHLDVIDCGVDDGVEAHVHAFAVCQFGNIAGSIVRSGIIRRNAKARISRNGKVIGDNLTVETLKRFKDDATEVRTDFECGIGLGSYNDITEGDIIETFEMREKPRV
jgi:translation initiation factor IF-2